MSAERLFAALGAISGFVAVALGAFAAHGLKARLGDGMLAVFETGVRYQMFHALGLFAVAWSCSRRPGPVAAASGWLFLAGMLLFSGSLYALALTGARALGMVTPIGGLAFLAGWLCLAWSAIRA
jgi:uncharacterized membrane protein YgdD (TMEM256/DUF423 family)